MLLRIQEGPSRKALDDMRLVSLIRELHDGHYWSLGIQVSMGNVCYGNADMEFLNGIIKTESLYCRFGKSRVRGKRVDASGIITTRKDRRRL